MPHSRCQPKQGIMVSAVETTERIAPIPMPRKKNTNPEVRGNEAKTAKPDHSPAVAASLAGNEAMTGKPVHSQSPAAAPDPDALLPIGTEVQVRFEGWIGFVSGMIKSTYVVYTKGVNQGTKALRPRDCLIPVVTEKYDSNAWKFGPA